jgi:tRNA1Val (adenine37-N6)-methyltransferase
VLERTPTTEDALFGGRVRLLQPSRGHGYRVNADAVLLAAFARAGKTSPARIALDLGAGVGAVALSLAFLGGAARLLLVEIDPFLAGLARKNVELAGLAARASVHEADVAEPLSRTVPEIVGRADLVVANPPYTEPHKDVRAVPGARHGALAPFLRAASEALGRRGRACFVYPAAALVDFGGEARRVGLEPKRMRLVHGREERPARVALYELVRGKPGGLVVEPPLVEMDASGRPTPALLGLTRA